MSATNKYELKFGFDSGYTKRIYSVFYINDQGNRELVNIKYANEDNLHDRDDAVEWFRTISTNHNNAINSKNQDTTIAEFVPDNDEFSAINQPVEAINYDEICDYFDEVIDDLLGYIHDYININVSSNFRKDVINRVKTMIHDRSAKH